VRDVLCNWFRFDSQRQCGNRLWRGLNGSRFDARDLRFGDEPRLRCSCDGRDVFYDWFRFDRERRCGYRLRLSLRFDPRDLRFGDKRRLRVQS